MKSLNTWRPDWKNKEAYPDIKTMTLEQWTWEFLRRNEAYQKQWLTQERFNLPEPKLKNDFGIYKLYDPATDWDSIEKPIFTPHVSLPIVVGPGELNHFITQMRPLEKTDVVIKFDLRCDLTSQLSSAEYQLKLWQAIAKKELDVELPKKRHDKELFPLYLQLLDAEYQTNITTSRQLINKVRPVLASSEDNPSPDFPVTRRLEANLKQARRMRDAGFKELSNLDKEFHKVILKHIQKEFK